MGLVFKGATIPCGAEVRFQPKGRAFTAADKGVGRRGRKPRLLVAHWNGSERGPSAIYQTLRNRGLACEFSMDHRGIIEQWADPGEVYCSHARGVNAFAMGIEIQNPGRYDWKQRNGKPLWSEKTLRRMRKRVDRAIYRDELKGKEYAFTGYTADQIEAFINLCDALVGAGLIPEKVPGFDFSPDGPQVCGQLTREMLPADEIKQLSGVCGHFHVSKNKLDPGPQLLEELGEHWGVEVD